MRRGVLWFILVAAPVWAEPVSAPERPPAVKKNRRVFGWLRKIGSVEPEAAMRLSGTGIPDPDRPPKLKQPVLAKTPAPATQPSDDQSNRSAHTAATGGAL